MEYVTGRQLGIIMLEEQQGMPVPRILSIMEQALDVLAAAHSCGITHRDIKPSEVARGDRATAIVPARRSGAQRGGSRTRSLAPAA
jgi:serine/threonine protein kinase